ncbi:MAG: alpha/beta fold hydrolase [Candidatus Micrarchaeota archaeon]
MGLMRRAAVAALALGLLISGCVSAPQEAGGMPKSTFSPSDEIRFQDVELRSQDGTRLSGTFLEYPDANDSVGVLFLHMLGSERTAWRDLQASVPHPSLAVDFRGHGNSEGGLKAFSDSDYAKFVDDARAGVEFLASTGATRFYVAGASIGANSALALASSDPRVERIAMLSPGLDYHGVKTEGLPESFKGESLYAVAGGDEYSLASTKRLYSSASQPKAIETLKGNAHGTGMLNDRDFYDALAEFLE